jgi:hypothetical protein
VPGTRTLARKALRTPISSLHPLLHPPPCQTTGEETDRPRLTNGLGKVEFCTLKRVRRLKCVPALRFFGLRSAIVSAPLRV